MPTDAETVAELTSQLAKQEKEFTAVKSKAVSKIKQLNQRVQELEKQVAIKGDDASTSGASSEGDHKDERFVKVESPGRGDTALRRREEELKAREEAVAAREKALEIAMQALAEREQGLGAAAARSSGDQSVGRAAWHDELLVGLQGIHCSLKDACARSMH